MKSKTSGNKLNRNFYKRETLTVAKELLGKTFVKNENGKILSGKIVEVEAYIGAVDKAAHTYNGKTKRNEIMFGVGGFLYVYFTYGIHFCSNVVTGNEEEGCAVLLRGIEPIDGLETIAFRRFGKRKITEKEMLNLTSGPAKICQAFNIQRKENGTDLLNNKIYILDAPKIPNSKIVVTTRIGIKKSKELPWRFYIKDNPHVSKK